MPLHWCNQLWLNLEEGCWKARFWCVCAGDHKLKECTSLRFEFKGQSQQTTLNCTKSLQPTLGTCAQTGKKMPTAKCTRSYKTTQFNHRDVCMILQNRPKLEFLYQPISNRDFWNSGELEHLFSTPSQLWQLYQSNGHTFCNWKLKWTSIS